jgi:hypothetical protein
MTNEKGLAMMNSQNQKHPVDRCLWGGGEGRRGCRRRPFTSEWVEHVSETGPVALFV